MPASGRYVLVALAAILFQWLVLNRLDVFGANADIIVLLAAWVGFRHGRRAGALVGFALGLALDAVTDMWGVHMLLKTLIGFGAGLLPSDTRESTRITVRVAALGGLIVALLHNLMLIGMLSLQAGGVTPRTVLSTLIVSSVYTAVLATIGALFATR